MIEDLKDLLAFSGLLILWPIGTIAQISMTVIISIQFFSKMPPVESLLISATIAGAFTAAGFLVIMLCGHFVANMISKFKRRS